MKTIEEIKALLENGNRKWGKDLYLFICPLIDQNYSMAEISHKLKDKHEVEVKATQLNDLKKYYGKKVSSRSASSPVSASFPDSSPTSAPDLPPEIFEQNEEVPQASEEFRRKKDYRIPAPKPKSTWE